jgi:transposase-like protein
MRRQYTGKQRADLIELVRSGRTTVAEAAVQLGVKPSTAYNWTSEVAEKARRRPQRSRKAKARETTTPRFVRVVPSGATESALAVRVGGAEIRVQGDFDTALLRAVVEALGGGR